MRDDSAKWSPSTGLDRDAFETDGLRMSIAQPTRQTVLSGPFSACLKLAKMQTAVGWPDAATGDTYALRLRRDRILAVNGPALADGWHAEAGVAVSDTSHGLVCIEFVGSDTMAVLQRGTEISRAVPSASATRLFAGHEVVLYARGTNHVRLHIARGALDSLWARLETFATQAESHRSRT